jgi:LysM repeat protein
MRSFLILSLSAVWLGGCLTTQENPNYEYSTTYKGDTAGQNQYASAEQVAAPITLANGSNPGIAQGAAASVSLDSPEAQRILAQSGATDPAFILPASTNAHSAPVTHSVHITQAPLVAAPTDSQYAVTEVSGTPGFMALQNAESQTLSDVQTFQAAAPALPAAVTVNLAPVGAAGTPINYDYSRNIITADAITTGQTLPETVRVLQGAGQSYTVRQGDTVYSLARRTCVGVNVIQSMNGLDNNFAIKIGQSLRLPQSVC